MVTNSAVQFLQKETGMKRLVLAFAIVIPALGLAACGNTTGDRALSGAGIGAGVGALGGLIFNAPLEGALIGGAVGAGTGAHSPADQRALQRRVENQPTQRSHSSTDAGAAQCTISRGVAASGQAQGRDHDRKGENEAFHARLLL